MDPELKRVLRTPIITTIALLLMLLLNGLLGYFFIANRTWIIEVLVATAMVATVITVTMEAHKEPGIIRLFSGVGFFWVAILFALTMVDYATR